MRLRLTLFLALFALVNSTFAADKPNFVWLLSEDNSKHYLELFDKTGAPTPRIEELAKHGLIFDHAFSNAPVCSVARTTLATGCYAPKIGTQYHRKSVTVPLPGDLKMFPAYLRDAGYFTTNKQKKDYNAKEGPGVWDISSRQATWRKRAKDQAFFHMQTFGTTHESSLHFSKRVMETEKTKTDPSKVTLAPYHPDTPTFRYTYARYHDRIQQVDQQIGAVVDQLEKDDLLEDTFVFYFGDHGGVLPRSKGYVYESGLHVPLVVRVPDKWKHLVDAKIGSRIQGFVSFVDFGPTLLQLAGIEIPDLVDGKPFLGKGISMAEVNSRDETFGYADRFDEKYDLVRSLRKGKFKYIRNYHPFYPDGLQNNYRYKMLAFAEWRELYKAGKLNAAQSQFFEARPPEQLFDVETDPHEVRNLAKDPKFSSTLADLRGRLSARLKAMPDLSMIPENQLFDVVTKRGKIPYPIHPEVQKLLASAVDIADLCLEPFEESKSKLLAAINTGQPQNLYWAAIALSSWSQGESVPNDLLKSTGSATPAVRYRIAENRALKGQASGQAALLKELKETKSGVLALMILNTVVLLRDDHGVDIHVTESDLQPEALKQQEVQRRLLYLAETKK